MWLIFSEYSFWRFSSRDAAWRFRYDYAAPGAWCTFPILCKGAEHA